MMADEHMTNQAKNVADQIRKHIDERISKKIQEKGYTYTITTPNRGWRDDNWDMWRNQYGHYNARCSITTTDDKKSADKEVKKMGLRIKKTDEMTIDEFKENTKAYDRIELIINKEKYERVEKEYGIEPFTVGYTDDGYIVTLKSEIIEFMEKAIVIDGAIRRCVPYYFIDKVVGTYYLTTGDD